jgi:riboflavin kinase / FMN adenylyltransferase
MIGFPTLNIPWSPDLQPRLGVYVVSVQRADGTDKPLRAVANYGLRPTVEQAVVPQLEVHILDPECGYGPGAELRVEWLAFLRPEQKFASLDALREQIARDRHAALSWFAM